MGGGTHDISMMRPSTTFSIDTARNNDYRPMRDIKSYTQANHMMLRLKNKLGYGNLET